MKRSQNPLYKCPYCEREDFRELNDQRAHIGEAHPGMDLNVCAVCNKRYSNRGNLVFHMKIHTGQKHVCTICNASFAYLSSLRLHVRNHTGEKPYECSVCDASFARGDALKDHMLSHTGEKPYICTVCDKGFGNAQNLQRHMLTHSGERSHACSICDKRFARPHQLKSHMQRHSKEKRFVCTVCNMRCGYQASLTTHMKNLHPSTYRFNQALTNKLSDPKNDFPDFEEAHKYVSALFREPAPVTPLQRCPLCGESFADLALHTEICPWRQGPSWE